MSTFSNAISQVFSSWNALQFAVSQQTGGPESLAISKWMISVTENFFQENKDLQPDEVAEFLNSIMDDELNTMVEDHSDLEISNVLCQIYKLYKKGDASGIESITSSLPVVTSNIKPIDMCSDEPIPECVSLSDEVSSLSINCVNKNSESNSTNQNLVTEENAQQNQDELDGWTVMKKGRRKKT